uniref:Putative RING finger protein P8B7.15c n=2 Tax=Talaromyces marneffei PM1 TaxID=1077442 RepID=A0A093W3R9_TALMA
MASSVHFKFKSQKEPSRVTFDGTGISVFELKREIISQNRLGDGTDFELSIYNEDTGEEYDDDTAIIPRSTSVIARRLPAARPGKGGAARYVSGKMPLTARGSTRPDLPSTGRTTSGAGPAGQASIPGLDSAQTEDEKIDALFNLQANQWKEQQQEMANATPVAFGRGRGKPLNVPDHPPPPGYLCYRCREKGHWIQACPTNNDPNFDGKYRVKRSTGIPRSLQTKVDKTTAMAMDGSAEDLKNSGVMVNADGDFVIAQPDKAAWELYQEKAKASAAAAAEAAAAEGSKELQARGLECPIDKRMFLEPTKTPCCNRTYCNDCITNALIESDFICPGCSTEGVLLDNLTVDDEAVAKIKAFEVEKAEGKKEKEKQEDNKEALVEQEEEPKSRSTSVKPVVATAATVSSPGVQSATSTSKKRTAEDEPEVEATERPDSSASFKKQKADDSKQSNGEQADAQTQNTTSENNDNNNMHNNMMPFPMNPQMPFPNAGFSQVPGMTPMPFDNNFMPGAMNPLMNPMMMPMGNAFQNPGFNGWNQMGGTSFPFPANGMFGDGSMMQGNNYGQFNNNFNAMQMGQGSQYMSQQQPGFQQGMGMNNFSNQQRNNYNYNKAAGSRDDDSPYFRQPVNPQRHQARQRRAVCLERTESNHSEPSLAHSATMTPIDNFLFAQSISTPDLLQNITSAPHLQWRANLSTVVCLRSLRGLIHA